MYNLGDVLPASAIGKMKAPIRLIENTRSSRRWPCFFLYATRRSLNPSDKQSTQHYFASTDSLQNIRSAGDLRLFPCPVLCGRGIVAPARLRQGDYL